MAVFTRSLLLTAVLAMACVSPAAKPSAVTTATPAKQPLHRGPLTDFVSAASLRWLLVIKPQQVLADPELERAISEIIPTSRFDAFTEASGVDLRELPHAAIAGFPYSTLYLAELPSGVAALARARFSERLLTGAVTKQPCPGLTRVTGVIGQTPETLLTVEDRILAISVGDPVPAKIAEAYARERLPHSPTALRGAALAALPELTSSNLAVLFAPGPFADEWQRAAGGLLQSTVAVAIAAQPIGNGKLATTLYLAGAWQDSGTQADAANRLRLAWSTFARSSAGHLFELDEAAEISATPEVLRLRVELELAALVRGLRASVLRDVSQILNLQSKTQKPAETPSGENQHAPGNAP
ncbi:MAG TPA: hypothetical protein VFK05_14515 [Polyangiaceae bacterium]|nr:hypothetical protein [Polyangiaceae bacterium]